MVTARTDSKDVVTGLNAGAEEYLTKPIDHPAAVARVRSMLRIKELHDRVETQAAELASWNRTLEQRVVEQLAQIERVTRLKRFLSPQIAELILSSSPYDALASHRRQVTIVFCDLRGFAAFAEIAEPEDVMAVMREYHATLGSLIHEFEGTLERFVGEESWSFSAIRFPVPIRARVLSRWRSRCEVVCRNCLASGGAKGTNSVLEWASHMDMRQSVRLGSRPVLPTARAA